MIINTDMCLYVRNISQYVHVFHSHSRFAIPYDICLRNVMEPLEWLSKYRHLNYIVMLAIYIGEELCRLVFDKISACINQASLPCEESDGILSSIELRITVRYSNISAYVWLFLTQGLWQSRCRFVTGGQSVNFDYQRENALTLTSQCCYYGILFSILAIWKLVPCLIPFYHMK